MGVTARLTNIIPQILSRGLLALREQAMYPQLVNRDYGAEAAKKGSQIEIPTSVAQAATEVTPSHTYSAPASPDPDVVILSLDQWYRTNFKMTDDELVTIERNAHYLPLQASESLRALANQVNGHVASKFTGVGGNVGTSTNTPFENVAAPVSAEYEGVLAATNARKVLNAQLCPRSERRAIIDYDAEAAMLSLPEFQNVDQVGEMLPKIEGEIGRKYGIDWFTDDAVPQHTFGSTNDAQLTNGGEAAGSKTVTYDTGTGSFAVGDTIAIAGQPIDYAITADTGTVLTISPALKIAVGDNVAITRAGGAASSVTPVNQVFHREAYAFANRPLLANTADMALGSIFAAATDPVSGLSLRLEILRQDKQVVWEWDILWGAGLVRPEYAVRIYG